ncbi:condensation domain-containing protein [Actinoplanes sp. N902-109]|uniref:condensation domain-containing protein n=1 Tax=Actinoplanes sp. (strain N902-109) TaxID=649831 RepID=UPI00032957B2|nr:condensation domain-containing protein [Actinoplanes sp. N902-109]AGL16007.1 LipNrps [Actinoplanes sp. N902-109]
MTATTTAATSKEMALWLLEQLVPGTGINNLGMAVRVDGNLRPDVLSAALAIVAGRHDMLRTVFRSAGAADLVKQTVAAGGFQVAVEPLELSGATLEEDLTAFVDRPFPLEGQSLLRAGHVSRPDGDVFVVAVHHLAADMISMALFLREFIAVYDAIAGGRPIPPATPTTAPAPEAASSPADRAYWRETLSGYTPGSLDLWCGATRSRLPVMTGGTARRTLSPQAQKAVQALQRTARVPAAAVLLAAYAALLVSHGAGADLVVGTPVDVRGTHGAAIGYHVNVVPLRLHVNLSTGFRDLARQARDAFLGAMAHADVSVDDLTGELPGVGSAWQSALFQHLFNFLPAASLGELSIDGMPARLVTVDNPYSKFDLELVGAPSAAELTFRYSREVLAQADVEAMLRRFESLLVAANADPDRPLAGTAGWSTVDRKIIDRSNASGFWTNGLTPDVVPREQPVRAFIAAPDGRELPIGLRGELCFTAGPDARTEKTGVLARWCFDGSIERLARPATADAEKEEQQPAADDGLVRKLTGLWRDLLGTEVTAHTGFFEAGGHSLLAAVLAQQVEELTGTPISLPEIFENPTPAALAARVQERDHDY